MLGALCGLLGERTGVVNIGIEGQLLMSAFTGFYTAAATGNIWVGVLAGVASGALLGLFLALCAVSWKIDQIIAGTVINIFVAGITSFLYTQGKQSPGGLDQIEIPLLSKIPLVGDVVFTNTPIALPRHHPRVRAPRRAVQHPLGPAQPVGRRAPGRGRHGRHQRAQAALPQRRRSPAASPVSAAPS